MSGSNLSSVLNCPELDRIKESIETFRGGGCAELKCSMPVRLGLGHIALILHCIV